MMFAPTPRQEVRDLRLSRIREIANAGLGRSDILPFWFGEGDQATPAFIREAASKALLDGQTSIPITWAALTCGSRSPTI